MHEYHKSFQKTFRKSGGGNRKPLIIIFSLLITIVLLFATIFAFFSDYLVGNNGSGIGVIDLKEGEFLIKQYSSAYPDGTLVYQRFTAENKEIKGNADNQDGDGVLENLNPGDTVEITIDIYNAGSKSGWLRSLLTLSGSALEADILQAAPSSKFKVYRLFDETPFTQARAKAIDGVEAPTEYERIAFTATTGAEGEKQLVATSENSVISGDPTMIDYETESANATNQVAVRYGIYFEPEKVLAIDDNVWQGATFDLDYKTESIQYRNNEIPEWSAIELYHDDYDDSVLEWDYTYTGSAQTFTAPVDGMYQFEAWGAKGGNGSKSGTKVGGAGGYTKGNIYLREGQMIHVQVGAIGIMRNEIPPTLPVYTGGGVGYYSSYRSGTGGGATDFRLLAGDWDNALSLNSRLMVAGGGGGGGTARSSSPNNCIAGVGGGLNGGVNGANQTNSVGKQTSAGVSSVGRGHGAFGVGGSSNTASWSNTGGGGGWYGGAIGGENTYDYFGGSGGSSFISGYPGCVAIVDSDTNVSNPRQHKTGAYSEVTTWHDTPYRFSDWVMKAGNEAMPDWSKADGSTMIGNTGAGHARIRLL